MCFGHVREKLFYWLSQATLLKCGAQSKYVQAIFICEMLKSQDVQHLNSSAFYQEIPKSCNCALPPKNTTYVA